MTSHPPEGPAPHGSAPDSSSTASIALTKYSDDPALYARVKGAWERLAAAGATDPQAHELAEQLRAQSADQQAPPEVPAVSP